MQQSFFMVPNHIFPKFVSIDRKEWNSNETIFLFFKHCYEKAQDFFFVDLGYVDRETNRLFRPFENCTGVFKLSLQASYYILCAKIVTFPYDLMFNHVLYVFESKAKIS